MEKIQPAMQIYIDEGKIAGFTAPEEKLRSANQATVTRKTATRSAPALNAPRKRHPPDDEVAGPRGSAR